MRLVFAYLFVCLSIFPASAENATIPRSSQPSPLRQGGVLGEVAADCVGNGKKCSVADFMKDTRVCALLVIKRGRVRLERYSSDKSYCKDDGSPANGPAKLYGIASVTKSITSTLLGAAIAERFHARSTADFASVVTRPIKAFIPDLAKYPASAYANVTLDRLLRMRSGVRWREWGWHGYFSDNEELMKKVRGGTESIEAFARRYKTRVLGDPQPFGYSGLNAATAALVAERIAGRKLPDFAFRKLWDPIGAASSAKWGVDNTGTPMGNCCLKATARDLGRFGMLVLNRGLTQDGRRVVPAAWIDLATTRKNGIDDQIPEGNPSQNAACPLKYRYFWWLRQKRSDFTAVGTNGQFIHIYPKSGIVIVQISDWQGWKDGDRRECATFRTHDAIVDALAH